MFPENAVKARKVLTTERKMSSLCTSFVNSAEQNSSLDASWVSSFVKLLCAAISVLCSLGNQKGCYKWVLASSCRNFRSNNETPVSQVMLRSFKCLKRY